MKCPFCHDARLVMTYRCGVEFDYCPVCRGVWIDRCELEKVLARPNPETLPPEFQERQGRGRRSFVIREPAGASGVPSPLAEP